MHKTKTERDQTNGISELKGNQYRNTKTDQQVRNKVKQLSKTCLYSIQWNKENKMNMLVQVFNRIVCQVIKA